MDQVGLNGLLRGAAHLPRFNANNLPGKPELQPLTTTNNNGATQPSFNGLTKEQANGLKVLHFAGRNFKPAAHLKLEAQFIDDLEHSQDATEKASLAEMLGRAHSINAIPTLIDTLADEQPVQARNAAAGALGENGDSTHPDSFTRTQLADALIDAYNKRKGAAALQQPKNPIEDLFSQLFGLAAPAKKDNEGELLEKELEAIVTALGRLNTTDGRSLLQTGFEESLKAINNNGNRIDDIDTQIETVENDLVTRLEAQFKKPIDDILDELDPDALDEMTGKLTIKLDNKDVSVTEARKEANRLEKERELASLLVLKQLRGLATQNDAQTIGYLRKGLNSQQPNIKAEALALLGNRDEAQYASDIYPNLQSKHTDVRDAAFSALMHNSEEAGRQKLVEYLNPETFAGFIGGVGSMDDLMQMMQLQFGLVQHLAGNGDKYIDTIKKIAVNKDYDDTTRAFSLLALRMMTAGSADGKVSEKTRNTAKTTLKEMALKPTGDSREEKSAIGVFATQLWAETKDPKAIGHALQLANNPTTTPEDQEALLISVYNALQTNTDALA